MSVGQQVGAHLVVVAHSLLSICRLHCIKPSAYLTDLLLQVGNHPIECSDQLTSRNWKQLFAGNSMSADRQQHTSDTSNAVV